MNLYEMTAATKSLYELLAEGEIDEQTFADTVESLGTEKKLESYCQVIKQLSADVEMLKAEKLRLAEKQSNCEKSIDRLKQAVTEFMSAKNSTKEKAGIFTISVRDYPHIVVDGELPDDLLTFAEPKPNKDAIKKALEDGREILAHIEYETKPQIK